MKESNAMPCTEHVRNHSAELGRAHVTWEYEDIFQHPWCHQLENNPNWQSKRSRQVPQEGLSRGHSRRICIVNACLLQLVYVARAKAGGWGEGLPFIGPNLCKDRTGVSLFFTPKMWTPKGIAHELWIRTSYSCYVCRATVRPGPYQTR